MKKALYMILLVAEFVVGFGLLMLATTVTGWAYFLIVAAAWVALMVLVLVKAKKAADEVGKRKAKVSIALSMLLPTVAAIAGFIVFVSNASW